MIRRFIFFVSLLPLVGGIALWIGSCHVARLLCTSIGEHYCVVVAATGSLHFEWAGKWPEIQPLQWHSSRIDTSGHWQGNDYWLVDLQYVPINSAFGDRRIWHCLGFQFGKTRFVYDGGIAEDAQDRGWTTLGTDVWTGSVPFWFAMTPFLLAATWCWRRHPPSAAKPGQCIRCHYDLRASKGRCPECGTAITAVRMKYG